MLGEHAYDSYLSALKEVRNPFVKEVSTTVITSSAPPAYVSFWLQALFLLPLRACCRTWIKPARRQPARTTRQNPQMALKPLCSTSRCKHVFWTPAVLFCLQPAQLRCLLKLEPTSLGWHRQMHFQANT